MAGRTTFLIAHRLSTLEGCDLKGSYVVDPGSVVQADSAGAGLSLVPRQTRP